MISSKSRTLGGKFDTATTVLFSVSLSIAFKKCTTSVPDILHFLSPQGIVLGLVPSRLSSLTSLRPARSLVTVEVQAIKPASMLSIIRLSWGLRPSKVAIRILLVGSRWFSIHPGYLPSHRFSTVCIDVSPMYAALIVFVSSKSIATPLLTTRCVKVPRKSGLPCSLRWSELTFFHSSMVKHQSLP